MSRANRALTTRLEDVQVGSAALTLKHFDPNRKRDLNVSLVFQRNLTKLNSEHKELEEKFQEERAQKEQFKAMKNNIEDERRLLDRTVEKLQREVSAHQCVVQKHDSCQIPTKSFAELCIYLESKPDKVLNPFCVQRLQRVLLFC